MNFDQLRYFCLLCFVILGSHISVRSNDLPNSPLHRCRTISLENPAFIIPASDNESAIIFENGGSVQSFNLRTFKLNWKTDVGGIFPKKPFVSNENLFFINESVKNAKIYSVSLKTGLTDWSRLVEENIEKPAAFELIRFDENSLILLKQFEILKINSVSGELLWRTKSPAKLETLLPLDEKTVITGDLEKFIKKISFEATHLEKNYYQTKFETVPDTLFSDKFKNIYISDVYGQIYVFEKSLKRRIWKFKSGGRATNFLDTEKGLIVTSLDNFVYMLSYTSGKILWKKRLSGRIITSPLLNSDTLIAFSYGATEVVFIDIGGGQTVNKIFLADEEFVIDTPIYFEGRYVFLTNKNLLIYQAGKCGHIQSI